LRQLLKELPCIAITAYRPATPGNGFSNEFNDNVNLVIADIWVALLWRVCLGIARGGDECPAHASNDEADGQAEEEQRAADRD